MTKPTESLIVDRHGNPYQTRSRVDAGAGVGGAPAGGLVNMGSGLGVAGLDKSQGSFFHPTRIYWRSPMEILYVQSWAAKKFVNIPLNDMFIRWRVWSDGEEDGSAETMQEAEKELMVPVLLQAAMWRARVHGGGIAVIMSKEAPLTSELNVDQIRPGDVKGIRVFDKFDVQVIVRDEDPFSTFCGGPLIYRITPSRGGQPFEVHRSRIVRFDGIVPPAGFGFDSYYDYDWGVSELIPAILTFLEDQTLVGGISHLSQEASIPVLAVESLREVMSGERAPDEPSAEQIAERINQLKSIFRLLVLDREHEEFTRVAVQFGGLADLMDKFHLRLAAAADIPATRFMGQSPVGMNATGESDMKNYVLMIEALRELRLQYVLPLLDRVIARHAGLMEPPPFEWKSLLELSEKEVAEAAKLKVETLHQALADNVIGEDEYRRQIDGDPLFGSLPEEDLPEPPEDPPPAPGPNPFMPPPAPDPDSDPDAE